MWSLLTHLAPWYTWRKPRTRHLNVPWSTPCLKERAARGTGRRPTWRVRRRRAEENDALAFPHGHRASRPAAEVAQICERNTALRCEARRSLKTHCSWNVSLLFYHYLSKVSFSLSSSERKVLTINLYHPILNIMLFKLFAFLISMYNAYKLPV